MSPVPPAADAGDATEPLLEPDMLLRAYAAGLFPMADADAGGAIGLYRADPRAIIPVGAPRVPRSVARAARRLRYQVAVDRDFAGVVEACAEGREDAEWLSPPLRAAYRRLHRLGFAHSVECWSSGRLVGGLFGVALGGLFTSESMFRHATDAGSIALVATAAHLRDRGYVLWDVQMASAHTRRFGAIDVSDREYRRRLAVAIRLERAFVPPGDPAPRAG